MIFALGLFASLAFIPAARAGGPAPKPAIQAVPATGVQWIELPFMPKGVKTSLVHGNPAIGPFVILMKIPAGTVLAPHRHTADEVATVVSGTILFGAGDKVDDAQATELGAGGYVSIPSKTAHWARAKTDTILVRYSSAALDISYVDPKDDPRAASSPKK